MSEERLQLFRAQARERAYWNQYYWPLLIVDSPEWRTTQIGITAFRSSEVTVYNLQMASTILVMLPTLILLVLGQRQLVRGLTAGALKG